MEQTTENKSTPEQRIADWWMTQFFELKGNWDNGDKNSPTGRMMYNLANANKESAMERSTSEQKKSLREQLVRIQLERANRSMQLYIDYHPDFPEAFEISGVDLSVCICKSGSYVKDGRAFVKCGYNGQYYEI